MKDGTSSSALRSNLRKSEANGLNIHVTDSNVPWTGEARCRSSPGIPDDSLH
jgi:hypothetical protein